MRWGLLNRLLLNIWLRLDRLLLDLLCANLLSCLLLSLLLFILLLSFQLGNIHSLLLLNLLHLLNRFFFALIHSLQKQLFLFLFEFQLRLCLLSLSDQVLLDTLKIFVNILAILRIYHPLLRLWRRLVKKVGLVLVDSLIGIVRVLEQRFKGLEELVLMDLLALLFNGFEHIEERLGLQNPFVLEEENYDCKGLDEVRIVFL